MPPLAAVPLLVFVLLPGLLVVRAPWTAVPALSVAFWALSAWWPPFAGLGRARFVAAAITVFGLLFLLRLLPKHEVQPPPWWPAPPSVPPPSRPGLESPPFAGATSLMIVGASLALFVPLPLWHHAPGPRLAFQTTMATLLLWRGAVPATAEPLLPLAPVGAHAPALATLAADVSRLSGLEPARSVLLVVVGGAGLLLVGLFALHAAWAPPRAAALGALVGLAVAPWPGALAPWGEGEGLLALGLALPAAALVVGHASRSSAVAAGMLLGASGLAQPVLATAVFATTVLAATVLSATVPVVRTGAENLGPRGGRFRVTLAVVVALFLAAPGLYPLAGSLSLGEARGVLLSVRPAELLPAALGVVLAALAPLLFRPMRGSSGRGRVATCLLALLATTLLVARLHGWIGSAQLAGPLRAALARVARQTAPLQPVCATEGARDWVPALGERAAGEPGPWIPPVYADEWSSRLRRACVTRLEAFVWAP